MSECYCVMLWGAPGRIGSTWVPCPPGWLPRKTTWVKYHGGWGLRRRCCKAHCMQTMLLWTIHAPLHWGIQSQSDNTAESGLCPTGIPALFLWRTLHQVPLFLLKSTQRTLSRMERHSDRMRTPICKVPVASNVNELRACCTSGLWLSSPGWDFTHGWFECRGDFSSHQKGQLELWLVATASTAIVEVSTFNSECWLLSSLLKQVCMARVTGRTVHFGRRERGWPLFCRAREPWPQFNMIGVSLCKELSKVAVGCQVGRHFAMCYQKTIKLRSREL